MDQCLHSFLLMCKLFTSTDDEYESGFVKAHAITHDQFKGDHTAAERRHKYMMIKMSVLFGFVYDSEKIMYGFGFELVFERKNNARAVYRDHANPCAIANNGNKKIRDISLCVHSIGSSNDNRMIVKKMIKTKELYRIYLL